MTDLPRGYVFDQPPATAPAGLPEGYTLDAPSAKGDRLPMAPGAVLHDMPADTVSRELPTITPGGSDIGASIGSRLVAGALDIPGIPGDLVDVADAVGRGVGQLFGMPDRPKTLSTLITGENATPPSRSLSWLPRSQDVKDFVGFKPYEAQTAAGKIFDKYVGAGIELVPGVAATGGAGVLRTAAQQGTRAAVRQGIGDIARYAIAPAAAGEVAGDVTKGTPLEPWARLGASVLTAFAAGGRRPPHAQPAPTADQLQAASNNLYTHARQQGLLVSHTVYDRAIDDITRNIQRLGIDPTIHPESFAALQRLQSERGISQDLQDIDTMRQILGDAAGSIKPADAMRAASMRDQLDNFMNNLQPADVLAGNPRQAATLITQARSLWSRQAKAREIGELFRRADLSAPNFSGSGMENALRTEFRALAKNQQRMRRFTAEERAAIENVARGGRSRISLTNLLRMAGKFAPTGVVSSALSGGAGFGIGGPVGAVALPAGGFAARALATRATMRNANAVDELVRRGRTVQRGPRPAPFAPMSVLYGLAADRSSQEPQ